VDVDALGVVVGSPVVAALAEHPASTTAMTSAHAPDVLRRFMPTILPDPAQARAATCAIRGPHEKMWS
jgi:hypothetical protein